MPARSSRPSIGALGNRVRRRLRSALPGRSPSVGVVVVVEPVDVPRLGAALRSVADQTRSATAVLVCPVGAAVVPAGSPTVEVLPAQPTWQRAASVGARAVTADYLVLVRGCDLLPSEALAVCADALTRSGSVLAAGRLDQAGEPEPWLQRAQHAAHADARTAHPTGGDVGSGLDLRLSGTMVRRTAWGERTLDEDDDWLLSTAIARILVGAGTAEVLTEPTYTWFPDHGTRAYGATPSALPALAARQALIERVASVLGDGVLAEPWRRTVAGIEVPRLLQEAERADPHEWRQLRALARSVTAHPSWWVGVGAAARVLVWLAAEDRRTDLEAAAAQLAALGEDLRTELVGTTVLGDWPVDLPDPVRALTPSDTRLLTCVSRVGPPGPDRHAELLVAIDHVDLADPRTRIVVHDPHGRPLESTPLPSSEANRWLGRRFQSAVAVAVRVPGDRPTRLSVEASVGGLTRTGLVDVSARVLPSVGPVLVEDLAVDGATLVVTGTGHLDRLRLLGRGDRPVPVPMTLDGGRARIDLSVDLFGTPTPLPPGSYRVVVGPAPTNVTVTDELRGRMPEVRLGSHHRVRAHLGPRGGLVLELAAPLDDDETGSYAQQRLQSAYAVTEAPVDPDLFYFESYAGRTATDSPRAIFEELRRRRPDLRAFWGVSDSGQRAPEGATPVLLRSRGWYDVLARAGRLVLNTDTEVWFRRRPGQQLLQTFHGYPSKAMGRGQWEAKDYPPSRVREFRARGVDTWSVILTPTPEMTRHYREQYDYDGPAIERGYPRDDDLVGPGAQERRLAARALLGIGSAQHAVLYAPTWRDHLASRPRLAAMTEFLDVAAAADALGDGHVLLLRGHRFHAPAPVGGAARVVDVTAYPEINDLILAADMAVLDYSSLRFDFALTGRPMVFLVPDLDEYGTGSRRFLFPFEDSAPGPLVRDTAEVVAQLRDPGLAERWAPRIADFNATYNPWQDGHAAQRVVDEMLGVPEVGSTPPPAARD